MKVRYILKESMSPEFGLIIPFDIRSNDKKKTLYISLFRELFDVGAAFEDKYSNDPFSHEALTWLYKEVGKYAMLRGYKYEAPLDELLHVSFKVNRTWKINKKLILPSTQRLTKELLAEIKENLTEFDFEENLAHNLPSYVTVIDGAVVSAACDNFGGELAEAALETAPDYRRRGYAASNTAALALEVLRDGREITYLCEASNTASAALAEKVGFKRDGMTFFCVMYEEEE